MSNDRFHFESDIAGRRLMFTTAQRYLPETRFINIGPIAVEHSSDRLGGSSLFRSQAMTTTLDWLQPIRVDSPQK